jgi:hypothetical protein
MNNNTPSVNLINTPSVNPINTPSVDPIYPSTYVDEDGSQTYSSIEISNDIHNQIYETSQISYILLLILVFFYPKFQNYIIYNTILIVDIISVIFHLVIPVLLLILILCCITYSPKKTGIRNKNIFASIISSLGSGILSIIIGIPIVVYLFSKNIVFPNIDDGIDTPVSTDTTNSTSP